LFPKPSKAAAGMLGQPCKACLIVLVLLALVLITPAAAGNFTNADTVNTGYVSDIYSESGTSIHYDLSADGYAVTQLQITVYHRPSKTDFTLYMLDGSTHAGSITYSNLTTLTCDITLILDGNNKHWTYFAPGFDRIPGGVDLLNTYIGTYATNSDTGELGILLAEEWISLTNIDNYVFSPDSQVSTFPISAIDISASQEVKATITYAYIDTVQKNIKNENKSLWEWIGQLFGFVGNVGEILFSVIAAFKFIVIDHWFALVVLYESVTMAYAASQSRDIFSFVRKFFRYNKALFEVILGFITIIIDIFHKLIDVLKP
jgi:hypothetical protein